MNSKFNCDFNLQQSLITFSFSLVFIVCMYYVTVIALSVMMCFVHIIIIIMNICTAL